MQSYTIFTALALVSLGRDCQPFGFVMLHEGKCAAWMVLLQTAKERPP